jgi:hypothetical protein
VALGQRGMPRCAADLAHGHQRARGGARKLARSRRHHPCADGPDRCAHGAAASFSKVRRSGVANDRGGVLRLHALVRAPDPPPTPSRRTSCCSRSPTHPPRCWTAPPPPRRRSETGFPLLPRSRMCCRNSPVFSHHSGGSFSALPTIVFGRRQGSRTRSGWPCSARSRNSRS